MPWSGAGVFTRVRNWATDKLNSINPQATLFDQEDDNFATGLNNCVTKDGLNKPTATMDWNSQRLTALADAAAATDAVNRQFGDARYARFIAKRKAASTSRASTVTFTDDGDLIAALETNSYYGYEFFLYTNGGAGGLKYRINYSGTTTLTGAQSNYTGFGFQNAVSSIFGFKDISGGLDQISSPGTGLSTDWMRIWGTIATTSTGNLSLAWAQFSSNVANSTIVAGSYLTIYKLG